MITYDPTNPQLDILHSWGYPLGGFCTKVIADVAIIFLNPPLQQLILYVLGI